MTEFTQSGIDRLRDIMNDGGEYFSRALALEALDHIERLQKRVKELEQERIGRVYCTADGEYPEDENQIVLAEFFGKDFTATTHIVGFEWDNAQWLDFDTEEIIPNVPDEMTVYWKPLTSLKDEYERQKGDKNE